MAVHRLTRILPYRPEDMFSLVGDGLCVGRDSGSAVSPEYSAPFAFSGGTIERVVIDVSGEHFVDHEKEDIARD